jgi:hypothetical protein
MPFFPFAKLQYAKGQGWKRIGGKIRGKASEKIGDKISEMIGKMI